MRVACVRSVLEHGAPAWYPFLSKTNARKLETLENRALRKIIGVLSSTRILCLHLESNILPIKLRWDPNVAFQSEKHRRHLNDDPLCNLSHETSTNRLKRKSWQTMSDNIFNLANINLSKKDMC